MGDPSALSKLKKAKFGDFWLPYTTMRAQAEQRVHIHAYRNVKGGRPEFMQRTLYSFNIVAEFHTTLLTTPPLWPDCINGLRSMFEQVKIADLIIPTMGTFRARIISWEQTTNPSVTSGESASIVFLEQFVGEQKVTPEAFNELSAAKNVFQQHTDALPRKPTIFDQITKVSDKILAQRDTALSFREGIVNQIDSFTQLLKEADATVALFDDPLNDPLLLAFQRLWLAAIALSQSPGNNGRTQERVFITDRAMTASEASGRIYNGDTSFGHDLMGINYFEDPLAIPAGTRVNYFVHEDS